MEQTKHGIFCMCTLGMLLLSGCSQFPTEDTAETAIPNRPFQAVEEPSGQTADTHEPSKALYMVSHVDGMLGKPGIASDTGYYDVAINMDGSANITYTDFETHKKIYLTSDLGANQNTDSDSSWFSDGIAYLLYDQDRLYIVGQPQLFDENPRPAVLWRCNPDGSNRTAIVEIPSNQVMMRGVAADGEGNFYTLMETTDNDGNTTNVLTEISIANSTLSPITEIPMGDTMIGVWKDSFLMTHVDTPDSETSMCELYALSVVDGSTQIIEAYELDSREMTVADGVVLYLDYTDAKLKRLELETKETKILAEALPLAEVRGANNVRGIWGNHFVIRISRIENETEIQTLYGWDITTGTVATNSYTYNQEGTLHSPELLTSADGYYLLNYDRVPATLQGTAADGTSYTVQDFAFPSAVMMEEDFWKDSSDFTEIDDLTRS